MADNQNFPNPQNDPIQSGGLNPGLNSVPQSSPASGYTPLGAGPVFVEPNNQQNQPNQGSVNSYANQAPQNQNFPQQNVDPNYYAQNQTYPGTTSASPVNNNNQGFQQNGQTQQNNQYYPQNNPAQQQEYIDVVPTTQHAPGVTGNQYFQVEGQPQVQPTKNKILAGKFNLKNLDFKKFQDWALKKWWLIVLVLAGISLITLGLFAVLSKPPVPTGPFNNVVGEIQAPVTSPAGSPNTWKVKVTNNEKVNLENVEIKLTFDKSFRFTKSVNPEPSDAQGTIYSFSRIAGNGLGTSEVLIQFEGVLTGQIDEDTIMTGVVTYTPSPLSDQPNNRKSIAISAAKSKVTAPEIKLSLVPSNQQVQNGSEAQITATFENTSGRPLKDLQLRMTYPDRNNFTYQSSQLDLGGGSAPKTTPDNGNSVWDVPNLPSQSKGTLVVTGLLSGPDSSKQIFVMEIAVKNGNNFQILANTSRDISVVSQPLIISTVIEGRDSTKIFKSGEALVVTVNYENKGTKTLQNVEVLAFLDDPADLLDYSTVSFVGGSAGNLSNKVVQWRASGNPSFLNVVPQQKGSVSFTVRTKTVPAFISSGLNQTAYTLRPRAQAKASNLDQIETSGDLYKAQGDLQFSQTIKQKTNSSGNSNLKTYTITWTFKTLQNKVNGVVLTTTSNLPPTAWKQASITPVSIASQLTYDNATGQIQWKPGDLSSYTGGTNPIVSISFDMDYDQGATTSNELFKTSDIRGLDDFTGEKFVLQGQAGQTN